MKRKMIVTLLALLATLLLSATASAEEAPNGVLLLQSEGFEYTIALEGVGYNLHSYSEIAFERPAGIYHFDYWCGGDKIFSGGVPVRSGETTIVLLQSDKCRNPAPPPPNPCANVPVWLNMLDTLELTQVEIARLLGLLEACGVPL